MPETTVAFLGLGQMGLPMALNLQRKGFSVTGWNRTPEKGQPLVEAGGRLAGTPREAVRGADFIVTMLGDPAAVRQVALGTDGFLAACRSGAVWIDASTIGPSAAREMAEAAARARVEYLDAPVLGSVKPATDGTLTFLVGGNPEALTRARPVLDAMGQSVHHFGAAGQGAAAKIVANMLTGTLVAALGEALALADGLGLERDAIVRMLMEGPAGAPIVRMKAPLMQSGDFPPAFQLRWMEKDLGLALLEAHRLGTALPAAAAAHGAYAAARAAGLGDQDFAAIAAFTRSVARGPAGRERA